MFDKLWEVVAHFWDWAKPFEVVMAYEGGVMLRLGKYRKTLSPGFYLKVPLVDYALTCHTAITTLQLRPQTLVTKDGAQVVISAIVKYQIKDPKPYLLDIWDSVDVLNDVTLGAIKNTVNALTYADLVDTDVEPRVIEAVRKECNPFGFRILKITFTDQGRIRTLRLMNTNESHHAIN